MTNDTARCGFRFDATAIKGYQEASYPEGGWLPGVGVGKLVAGTGDANVQLS